MGTDIHIHLIANGKFLLEDMFDGRNSFWFDKIHNEEDEYRYLNWQYNVENIALPQSVLKEVEEGDFYCYGFKYVKLSELLEWYDTYKPYIDAGWVRKIDAWKYRVKHIPIEDNIYPYLDDDAIIEDWEFVEVPALDDCMEYVVNQIKELIPLNLDIENSYLVVYFDG